ncbi:hypothetical protein BASA81_008291 [Batrachochytrium salamandrivorans]|nr:hypothetical protein BASA81_008291 [Batrachochytrium salamandrivorans]
MSYRDNDEEDMLTPPTSSLLVKTYQQFLEEGCENCADAFEMKDDEVKIADVTTQNFEGLAAITQPGKSWVAEWQFTNNFVPGVYALKVKGEVSALAEEELANAKMPNIGKMLQAQPTTAAATTSAEKQS